MLLIPEQLAQAILNYLATKPAGEVFTLIANLQNLEAEDKKD